LVGFISEHFTAAAPVIVFTLSVVWSVDLTPWSSPLAADSSL
jgi:hypothetical protein